MINLYYLDCYICGNLLQQRGFPGGSVVKNLPANAGDSDSTLGREDPLENERQSILVFSRGESHGQRSLAGYTLWGLKRVRHD